MGKVPAIDIDHLSYRGINPLQLRAGSEKNEFGFFDLRPRRFAIFERTTAEDILVELVNLPDQPDSKEVKLFLSDYPNLLFDESDVRSRKAPRMPPEMLVWLSGLYRIFWEPRTSKDRGTRLPKLKASIFIQLLGPDLGLRKLRYPVPSWMRDYSETALRLNWNTVRLKITARGPIDDITHAAFFHRNRLCECSNPNCRQGANGSRKLFIASPGSPNESLCSPACRVVRPRQQKRDSARRRRARLRVDGLTSRKTRPKRNLKLDANVGKT